MLFLYLIIIFSFFIFVESIPSLKVAHFFIFVESIPFLMVVPLSVILPHSYAHLIKYKEKIYCYENSKKMDIKPTKLISLHWITYPLSKYEKEVPTEINDNLIDILHEIEHSGVHWSIIQVKSYAKQWN